MSAVLPGFKAWLSLIALFKLQFYLTSGLSSESLLPENQLRRQLFQGYDPHVFPRPLRQGEKLRLNISVSLLRLFEVNIRDSSLRIHLIIEMKWNNHQLSWNASTFSGLQEIETTKEQTWIPHILLKHSGEILTSDAKEPITVSSNGNCHMVIARIVTTTCKFDITKFPEDSHTCVIGFLVRNAKRNKLSIGFMRQTYGRLIQSSAWTIEYTNKSLFTAGRDYDVVDLTIKIKRKSAYTRRKILYPLFILAFMTVFVYLVPPESGERTALAITAVLTMVLSVQYLMDQLPESDDEPWCVFMARLNMAAMAISLLLTCLVLNVYYRKGTFMPRWIKFVFVQVLGRLVFVGNMACKSSDKSDTKFEINLESKANENVKKGADTVERKDDWVLLASVIDRCCMIWLTALAIGTAYTLSY